MKMRACQIAVVVLAACRCIGHAATDSAKPEFQLSAQEVREHAAEIDRELLAYNALLKLQDARGNPLSPPTPGPAASDEAFVRRVYLDLLGRIPTTLEARRFLAGKEAGKRRALIDQLLATDEAIEQRFLRLADLLRVQDEVLGESQRPYIDWLRKAVGENMPMGELIRTLVMATGSVQTNPATGYLLTDHGYEMLTLVDLGRICQGEDYHCTRCHDHPFFDHTQLGFYQLAACLAATRVVRGSTPIPVVTGMPMQSGEELWPKPPTPIRPQMPLKPMEHLVIEDMPHSDLHLPVDYKYINGRPGLLVNPCLPNGPVKGTDGKALRKELAAWLTSPANGRFATLSALRVLGDLFGLPNLMQQSAWHEGDSAADADPSRTERNCTWWPQKLPLWAALKDHKGMQPALAAAYNAARGQVREMQRIMANTEAYQRESTILDEEVAARGNVLFTTAPLVRKLTAEQVWDSLANLQGHERGFRCATMPQALPADHELTMLGRSRRTWSVDTPDRLISHGTARFLMNGDWTRQLNEPSGKFAAQVGSNDDAFLTILGRSPSTEERKQTEASDRRDVLWALLNTTEFLFQH